MINVLIYVFLVLGVAGVAWLGQWGRRNLIARYVVMGIMILLGGLLALGGGLVWLALRIDPAALPDTMPWISTMLISMGVLVIPCLVPTSRQLFTRVFPGLQMDVPAHTWALYIFLLAYIVTLMMLTVLYNPTAILESLEDVPLTFSAITNVSSFVLLSYLASGAGIYQSWGQATQSLGLGKVSWKMVGNLLALALVLTVAIQYLESWLMTFVSPEVKHFLEQIANAMKVEGPPIQVIGSAALVGLSAGIGEELVFRGLMQPVFGVIPTALLFAFIHMHYGPTVLLFELLIIGVLLGVIRQRMNTTAAIIVHAAFDFFALSSSLFHP